MKLRAALEAWMVETDDHMLGVFRHRDDSAVREAYVQQKEQEAQRRKKRKTLAKQRTSKPRPKK